MREREAGKALDAEIAARVMGWTAWCSPMVPRGSTTPDCWQTGNTRSPTVRINGFRPSTDIADAWLVVEKMHEKGFDADVRMMGEGFYCDFSHYVGYPTERGVARVDPREGGMPFAICIAALKALAALSSRQTGEK